MIYKNPYYVNKDPLKTILFDGNNGSGKPMLYRNPFVPGAEYGYDYSGKQKPDKTSSLTVSVVTKNCFLPFFM